MSLHVHHLRAGRLCCALLFLSVCAASMARAQDTVTGAFEGTVTSTQTGASISGASVEIVNQATGIVKNLRSDARGRFYQGLLPPGIYTIRVAAPGFQTREVRQRLFITRTGEVVPVPVALEPDTPTATTATPATAATTPAPASSAPTGEDTDIRARINVADGQRGGALTEEELLSLPLGANTIVRSFDELALLLPGVAPPPQTLGSVAGPGVGAGVGTAGQFAVNGLRSRGNNFTVDGSDNNDEDIGVRRQGFVALVPQPIESIKEYQTITLLAPAQFGRNIGAQVNAVSKSGGSETHGALFGLFNASQLNARDPFDTTLGNGTTPLRAGGRTVLLNGRQVSVTNGSGGEDSFTAAQFGLAFGGPLVPNTARHPNRGLFYFISGEGQIINATKEESFAVPTVEQRGLFGSGASGLARDPLTGRVLQCTPQLCEFGFPTTVSGDAVFSLFPFPNNPAGLYGANTFTQALPSGGQGRVFSGKTDGNFVLRGRPQQLTVRYNYADDYRDIPATGGALFSALRARVKTQNLSNFLNSELSAPGSARPVFNQVRASYGRTRLVFDEIRETGFLRASRLANAFTPASRQFLLNAPLLANITLPNGTNVLYDNFFNFGVEDVLGPLGQVSIAGYSPVGVDVFNFPQRRVNNTYQVADSLTARFPRHSLAFGIDLRRSELNSDLPRNARSLITFNGAPRLVSTTEGQTELRGFFNPLDLAAASAPSGVFQALTTGAGSAINLRYYQLNFYAQDDWRVQRNLSLSLGLRYEYNTPPRELNRRIENTFSDPALALVAGLRAFVAGRTSIFDPDRNNFAPRASIAYATHLFGSRRTTVLRAGAGIFYDQALGAVVSQSRNVFPNFLTLNLAGGVPIGGGVGFNIADPSLPFFPCPDGNGVLRFFALTQAGSLNQLNPGVPLSCLVSVNNSFPGGFGVTLPERRLEMPTAYHYAFTFEQQLDERLVFSAAYVGTQGRHLLRLTTPNLGPNAFLIPTAINIVNNQPNVVGRAFGPGQRIGANGVALGGRPVTQAGAVTIYESSANSSYNSLQLQLRGRGLRALQFQLAYTFANATDDVSDIFDLAGASALPQDSFDLAQERGPANFDVRHRLAYNFIYDLPVFADKFARAIFGNLQLAGSGSLQTGQPFTVNSIFDVNLDGNLTDRLDTDDGLVVTGDRRQPLRLNVAEPATLLARVGQDGRVGRNSFRAGNIVALDLALAKRFNLTAQQSLTLRADIFNLINRANYGIPVRFLEAPGFGQATNAVTPARRLQFALKYSF